MAFHGRFPKANLRIGGNAIQQTGSHSIKFARLEVLSFSYSTGSQIESRLVYD